MTTTLGPSTTGEFGSIIPNLGSNNDNQIQSMVLDPIKPASRSKKRPGSIEVDSPAKVVPYDVVETGLVHRPHEEND